MSDYNTNIEVAEKIDEFIGLFKNIRQQQKILDIPSYQYLLQ